MPQWWGVLNLLSHFALSAWQRELLACAHPDLERELLSVDREEAKLVKEIKSAAAKGNESAARVLAKSLVRLRGQKAKLHAGILQMRGVRSTIAVRAFAFTGAPYRPAQPGQEHVALQSSHAANGEVTAARSAQDMHAFTERCRPSSWPRS